MSTATTSATVTKAPVKIKVYILCKHTFISFSACSLYQPTPMFSHLKLEKKVEEPLPIPFDLPKNYSKDVMEELRQNRLSGIARAKFMASICSAIFKYKSLPTPSEYNHVAEQIVEQYPFLKSKSGSGYVRQCD